MWTMYKYRSLWHDMWGMYDEYPYEECIMIVYEGNLTKCGTKERESRAGAWIYEGYCGVLWTYCEFG